MVDAVDGRKVGLNQTAVLRIWRAFGLKPYRIEGFKLSTDPQFVDKVRVVDGLYLNPPDAAVCCASMKGSKSKRWDRTAPMLPGAPELHLRPQWHLGLVPALDVAGKVITQMTESLHETQSAIHDIRPAPAGPLGAREQRAKESHQPDPTQLFSE